MVEFYAETLNQQQPINLENLWETIARRRDEQALEAALKDFEHLFSSQKVPISDVTEENLARSAEASFQEALSTQVPEPRQPALVIRSQKEREYVLSEFNKRNYRAGKRRAEGIMQRLLEKYDRRGTLSAKEMEQLLGASFQLKAAAKCPLAAIVKVEGKLRQLIETKSLSLRVRQLETQLATTSEAPEPSEEEEESDDSDESEELPEIRRARREYPNILIGPRRRDRCCGGKRRDGGLCRIRIASRYSRCWLHKDQPIPPH